jgi:biotin carboxyl carrier protein
VRVLAASAQDADTREFTGWPPACKAIWASRWRQVIERLVDAGQTVRKGQPLMRLDRTDLALRNRRWRR